MISNIRTDYKKEGFTRENLVENPIELFREWFKAALENERYDPNAMSLATVNNLGYPSCRIVLLKEISDMGFTFFTNYESRKGQEMEANNRVAATFFWQEMERQVRIRGYVEKISEELSDSYFSSRPIDSQISAIVSSQSKAIEDLAPLREHAIRIKEENQPIKPHAGAVLRTVPPPVIIAVQSQIHLISLSLQHNRWHCCKRNLQL